MENIKYFICEKCNYKSIRKNDYEKHCKTIFHITGKRKTRSDMICNIYKCSLCDYSNTNKHNYDEHMLNNHASLIDRKTKFKFYCQKCDFGINVESIYKKHCETIKHKRKLLNN